MEKEKLKEKIEAIKKQNPEQIRVSKTGVWKLVNGKPVFEEETVTQLYYPSIMAWKVFDTETHTYTPEEKGFRKEFEITILLMKSYVSREEYEGTEDVFFKQDVSIQVRPDKPSVYLVMNDNGKVFIRCFATGQTFPCPLNSTPDITVKKSKPKRISIDEARELKTPYKFSKALEVAGKTEYGIGFEVEPAGP